MASGNDVPTYRESGPPRLYPNRRFCSRCLELDMPDLYPFKITGYTLSEWRAQNERMVDALVQRIVFDVDHLLSDQCLSCGLIHDDLYNPNELRLVYEKADFRTYRLGSQSRRLCDKGILFETSHDMDHFEPTKELRLGRSSIVGDKRLFLCLNIDDSPHNRRIRDPEAKISLEESNLILPRPGAWKRERFHQFSEQKRSVSAGSVVDFGHLRHWNAYCRLKHKACRPRWKPELETISLIDTRDRTVIGYPSDDRPEYAALSYVWGKKAQSSQLEGRNIPFPALPSVEDAITATKNLKLNYLWVDAICIDQNNEEKRQQQIGIMNHIYAGASVTLIAAAGDSASSGLHRVSRGQDVKSRSKEVVKLFGYPELHKLWMEGENPNEAYNVTDELSLALRKSKWDERGWTFQEALFSRRCLLFTETEVFFHCNDMITSESLEIYNRATDLQPLDATVARSYKSSFTQLDNPFGENIALLGQLSKYSLLSNLIKQLVQRRLSYEADTLRAMDGILNEFQDTIFPEGFHYALPLVDFRQALSWSGRVGIKYPSGKIKERKTIFPSWSWAGWHLRYYNHEITNTHLVNSPRLSIWTPDGRQIVRNTPFRNQISNFDDFLCNLNNHFETIPDLSCADIPDTLKDSQLYVQGILIQFLIRNSRSGDPGGICRVESPLGKKFLAFKGADAGLRDAQSNSTEASSLKEFLLVSVLRLIGQGPYESFEESSLELRLLELKYCEDGSFERAGEIAIRVHLDDYQKVMECRPSLETFILG